MSLLAVDGVGKRFGGVQAVLDVGFTVTEGEIVGLIGPNGAGKTTLFHLVAGTLRPDQGRIVFMGRDITAEPAWRVCRLGIARTFQVTRPFAKMTCLENVMVAFIGRGRGRIVTGRQGEAEKLLALTGLTGKQDWPAGQLNLIDKKRLEVARALATGPKLILLDEVLGGLNSAEMGATLDLIRDIRDRFGVSVVWIEHVMGALMSLSERVLVLDQGRLIAEGPPEAVCRDPRVISAYLGEQDAAA